MGKLEELMDVCGFKKPEPPALYRPWSQYIDDVVAFSVQKTRPRAKKQALILVGIYSLFIEYLAGCMPDVTVDEACDGGTYMARAALEFRDRFIHAMMRADKGDEDE